MLYLLGAWLRRGDKLSAVLRNKPCLCGILILVCCAVRYKIQVIDSLSWYDYNSPLNILMAILVFSLFNKINVNAKYQRLIMFLSSSAVAVYCVTDYSGLRHFIGKPLLYGMLMFEDSAASQFIFIITSMIAGFIVICVFDKIRIYLTSPLVTYIENKLFPKI